MAGSLPPMAGSLAAFGLLTGPAVAPLSMFDFQRLRHTQDITSAPLLAALIGVAMTTRKRPVTPLAAVAAGLLAGGAGTVCLDTVHYLKQRRAGSRESPLAWEFAPIDSWEKAPAPGQAARRLVEGFTQREIPDRWAWVTSTAAHWSYGSLAGALYGVLAGSLPKPHALYGVPFGAAVFAGDYVALPLAGLYQPIWEYDATTLAWDLGAHLAYGAGTGTAFRLLTKIV